MLSSKKHYTYAFARWPISVSPPDYDGKIDAKNEGERNDEVIEQKIKILRVFSIKHGVSRCTGRDLTLFQLIKVIFRLKISTKFDL